MIRLLPHLHIVNDFGDFATYKFRYVFRSGWNKLKATVQADIGRILADKNRKWKIPLCSFKGGIVHLCYKMDYGPILEHPTGPFGRRSQANVFTFLAPFVIIAKEIDLEYVIIHELTHCWLEAVGRRNENIEIEEKNVRDTMVEWELEVRDGQAGNWPDVIKQWEEDNKDKAHLTEKSVYDKLFQTQGDN